MQCLTVLGLTGLNSLLELIQEKILEVTERNWVKFRVPNGGEEYAYVNKLSQIILIYSSKFSFQLVEQGNSCRQLYRRFK